MRDVIVGSAIGTVIGIVLVAGFWYACDWLFDQRDTDRADDE